MASGEVRERFSEMPFDGGADVGRQCERLGNSVYRPSAENSTARKLRGLDKMRELDQISGWARPLNTLDRAITR